MSSNAISRFTVASRREILEVCCNYSHDLLYRSDQKEPAIPTTPPSRSHEVRASRSQEMRASRSAYARQDCCRRGLSSARTVDGSIMPKTLRWGAHEKYGYSVSRDIRGPQHGVDQHGRRAGQRKVISPSGRRKQEEEKEIKSVRKRQQLY